MTSLVLAEVWGIISDSETLKVAREGVYSKQRVGYQVSQLARVAPSCAEGDGAL